MHRRNTHYSQQIRRIDFPPAAGDGTEMGQSSNGIAAASRVARQASAVLVADNDGLQRMCRRTETPSSPEAAHGRPYPGTCYLVSMRRKSGRPASARLIGLNGRSSSCSKTGKGVYVSESERTSGAMNIVVRRVVE